MTPCYYITYSDANYSMCFHKAQGEVVWFERLNEAEWVAQNMRSHGRRNVIIKRLQ